MIEKLPPEVLLNIISHITYKDISILRLTSKKLRSLCDLPYIWKSMDLKLCNEEGKISLWKLSELKEIIDPHTSHIQSIRIWGVRDNIVRYLLLACHNLQHLTICGWTTLSDHCLRLLPSQSLKIKTLELIGSTQETNFMSLDAYSLSNLLIKSPQMTNLVIGCDSYIHADTFLSELETKRQLSMLGINLQLLSLNSRKTWLNEHLLRLTQIYPTIQKICLMSSLFEEFNIDQDSLYTWISKKLNEIIESEQISIHTQDFIYSSDDMLIYNRPFILSN